jgi:cation diffusion facilitator CzcD-associated flavoprotein CzcO
MYSYIKSYADRFDLFSIIRFQTEVLTIEEVGKNEDLYKNMPVFAKIKFYEKLWRVVVKDLKTGETTEYITPYVSICSGHHATPIYAEFPGQDTFPGKIFHSVKYKSSNLNEINNQRVLVVGIGNSAVDVAVNLHNEGRYVGVQAMLLLRINLILFNRF